MDREYEIVVYRILTRGAPDHHVSYAFWPAQQGELRDGESPMTVRDDFIQACGYLGMLVEVSTLAPGSLGLAAQVVTSSLEMFYSESCLERRHASLEQYLQTVLIRVNHRLRTQLQPESPNVSYGCIAIRGKEVAVASGGYVYIYYSKGSKLQLLNSPTYKDLMISSFDPSIAMLHPQCGGRVMVFVGSCWNKWLSRHSSRASDLYTMMKSADVLTVQRDLEDFLREHAPTQPAAGLLLEFRMQSPDHMKATKLVAAKPQQGIVEEERVNNPDNAKVGKGETPMGATPRRPDDEQTPMHRRDVTERSVRVPVESLAPTGANWSLIPVGSVGAISVEGRDPRRTTNQDCILTESHLRRQESYRERGYLYIVADGVAGGERGERASEMAAQAIRERYYGKPGFGDPGEALRDAVEMANNILYAGNLPRPRDRWMHTTCVCAVIWGDRLYVAHVGDSRAYLLEPGGRIACLTKDQMWHNADKSGPKTLGAQPDISSTLEVQGFRLEPGHTVVLCTDGLWRLVRDGEISSAVSGRDPRTAARKLYELVDSRGRSDDASVVVVQVGKPEEEMPVAVPQLPFKQPRLGPQEMIRLSLLLVGAGLVLTLVVLLARVTGPITITLFQRNVTPSVTPPIPVPTEATTGVGKAATLPYRGMTVTRAPSVFPSSTPTTTDTPTPTNTSTTTPTRTVIPSSTPTHTPTTTVTPTRKATQPPSEEETPAPVSPTPHKPKT